jgi:hypothetical protein
MRTLFSGGSGRERAEDRSSELRDLESPVRRSLSIRWLIVCGMLLVAAIATGTAVTIDNFRERALTNRERELENTVLLLARHFDQQLQQLELVQTTTVEQIRSAGITSRDDFERKMSGYDVHLMLKTKIEALPQVGNLNLADSDGKLINSANAWPVPAVTIADRAYFKALKAAPQLTTTLSEPVFNRITGAWTTVLARSLTGPKGEFLGVVLGGIELAQFENFFTSVALGEGTAITMSNRDGTLLVRHPHVEEMIGRNFKTGPMF